uniref:Homeobox domain-containing protein n=1 Tax=Poecilia latipinna TaxID=48699 RepID=A0A3B3UZ72_9TELE
MLAHCYREKETELQERKSKGKRYRDMRRSRTIIQAEQLDILYGCYFKDPNPGKHEFEQIAEWVHLPKKVVQIWFQNMRARERKGEVRFISDGTLAAKELAKAALVKKVIPVPIKPKEVAYPTAGSPVSSSITAVSGSYLHYSALKANRPILPKPVQLTITEPAASPVPGQPAPKETLTGHCDACNVSFESRAAARAHVFSPHHLGSLSTAVTSPGTGSEGEIVIELPPSTATSNS